MIERKRKREDKVGEVGEIKVEKFLYIRSVTEEWEGEEEGYEEREK